MSYLYEEVYDIHTDTAGNWHWIGTGTGHHVLRLKNDELNGRKDNGMSKHIKLDDATSKIVNTLTRVITDDLTALVDRQHEIIDMLADLPTIEVSEDCISREWLYNELNKVTAETLTEKVMITEFYRIINDAQSVVPTTDENKCHRHGIRLEDGTPIYECIGCDKQDCV